MGTYVQLAAVHNFAVLAAFDDEDTERGVMGVRCHTEMVLHALLRERLRIHEEWGLGRIEALGMAEVVTCLEWDRDWREQP